jgi:hypothetical protein
VHAIFTLYGEQRMPHRERAGTLSHGSEKNPKRVETLPGEYGCKGRPATRYTSCAAATSPRSAHSRSPSRVSNA